MRGLAIAMLGVACAGDTVAAPPSSQVFGGDRPVLLQLPEPYDDSREYPLVLALHGYAQRADDIVHYLQLDTFTDVFLLAPPGMLDSRNFAFWNADPGCCDLDGIAPDDVDYLGTLIEDVRAAWPVDPARVFVVGNDNGAFMGYRMACQRADLIAATAILGGNTSQPFEVCDPSEPTSMLILHGDLDDIVPFFGGGVGRIQNSIGAVESLQRWAAYNGCLDKISGAGQLNLTTIPGADTTIVAANGCGNAGVELWRHEGAGHAPNYNGTLGPDLWRWLGDHARE